MVSQIQQDIKKFQEEIISAQSVVQEWKGREIEPLNDKIITGFQNLSVSIGKAKEVFSNLDPKTIEEYEAVVKFQENIFNAITILESKTKSENIGFYKKWPVVGLIKTIAFLFWGKCTGVDYIALKIFS